jgi:poly-gamma-glutamate capsule biosynthesis protein CapA/YwtB (metallophosphatase superfamily)
MIRRFLISEVLKLVLIVAHIPLYGQSHNYSLTLKQNSQIEKIHVVNFVIDYGKTLLGKPYKHVTPDKQILDCSGFISHIYKQIGLDLPSSSSGLASISEKISLSEIKKGDLMFFTGRDATNKHIGHVSLVTSVDGDIIEMMHSCIRGIIVETYSKNEYYTSRFLFAGTLSQVHTHDALKTDYYQITDTAKIMGSINLLNYQNQIISKNISEDNNKLKSKTVKIIAVGDIMLGTNYPNSSYLPPNDGRDILQPIKKLIRKGDVSFGNLEGVLLSGEGRVKKCLNPKNCYAFKMPDHYADYLVEGGFNLLSLANNHSMDFGSLGSDNTISILKKVGIHYAGLEECPYTTFEKDGIRYGFAAFAPNTGTIKINDYIQARKIISHLDSISDIVIISFHGGAEGSEMKHITRRTEIFLGENRGNPYEFARMAIDAGADVVLGHGPHVTRAIDTYNSKFIAYSLGNFATYGRFNLSGPNGIAPILELNLSLNGTFISGKIYSTKQLGEGGPVMDEENRALKEIQKLTRADIPECNLNIESDGKITKINNPTKR